ncbi:replication initiation protein RepC [Ruegeria arenilitoris]
MRFFVLGYILQRVEKIQSPGAYLHSLLAKIEKGELSPKAMLSRTSNAS